MDDESGESMEPIELHFSAHRIFVTVQDMVNGFHQTVPRVSENILRPGWSFYVGVKCTTFWPTVF